MRRLDVAFCRPGSDLLSRVLRRSTIGAGAFHGRVRNGNGCSRPAITTRSAKRNMLHVFTWKLLFREAGELKALFNLTRLSVTHPYSTLARSRAWQPYRPEVVAPCGAARPEPFGRQDRTDHRTAFDEHEQWERRSRSSY